MGDELANVAAVLLDDETIVDAVELRTLFAGFSRVNAGSAALVDAWHERASDESPAAWLERNGSDAAFRRSATDLALTTLFGAVFVDEKVADGAPTEPGWAFTGRFWSMIQAHPPALSMGPFGHWAYPPGARRP
jgi:hypothetical protein